MQEYCIQELVAFGELGKIEVDGEGRALVTKHKLQQTGLFSFVFDEKQSKPCNWE